MLNDAKKNGYERERETRRGREPLNRALRREHLRDRHATKQQLRDLVTRPPSPDTP